MRRHIRALDGLRGAAVCGVLAFHLGHLQGGYLGVDLFFVLSGYLITSLMLAESASTGRIDLGAFWSRRARRLLPALFLVVGAIAVYAATDPRGVALGALRGDALATLGYVANWHSLWTDTSYWELFSAPSLLQHTWSLAIEEQLYVLWPLVVVGILRVSKRSLRMLLVSTLALAVASWTVMALVHVEGGDTARAYFGTDTRAGAVMIGAALAIWIAWRGPVRSGAAVQVAGVVGAAVLAVAWVTVEGTTGWLYEGGFAVLGIAATAVIASISDDSGPLARLLHLRPLRHLGTISYGVYLWHWPVFVVLDDRPIVVKLLATLVLSELSFHLVEWPIRKGSLGGWRIRVVTPAAAAAVVAGIVVTTTAVAPGPSAVASVPAGSEAPPPPPSTTVPPPPDARRLLVVGDSGGWFLGEGFVRIASERNLAVRNAGAIGCGVVTEGGRLRVGDGEYFVDPDWCEDWPTRWVEELEAHQADVALLVLAWPGLGERLIEGEWRIPCDPVFDAHYRRQVRRAYEVLGSTGARVVVADSPYLRLPVGDDADDIVDCLNDIYRSEARAAGIAVLGFNEWVCPGGPSEECIKDVDGVELRWDGIHFQDEGADIAARWAAPQLVASADASQ